MHCWFDGQAPVTIAGVLQIAIAAVFAAIWLSDVVPALIKRTSPPGLAELGLLTDPVHVLDLSILLPALVVGGVSLLRGRSTGYFLAPVMLTFGVLMSVAIAGMIVQMDRRGIAFDLTISGVFGAIALVTALVLAPRGVLLAHDVTVNAGPRITAEVGQPPGHSGR